MACVHAERCGGCPMIGLAYADQLTHKRGRVVNALARYPSLAFVYADPVIEADPVVGYRTRAKLIVGRGGDLGLYARGGGHEVVDIPNCLVLSPLLSRVTAVLRARIREDEANGGALASRSGDGKGLRALDLREIRGDREGVLVTLVAEGGADIERYRAAAQAICDSTPDVLGVALNLHLGDSPQVLGRETIVLCGVTTAVDRVGDSLHIATYGSFVQAHRKQAERVHRALEHALGLPTKGARLSVLDLYGGSGAIALALAKEGARVEMVEAFAPAAEQAQRAAKDQKLDVVARAGDVAAVLRELVASKATFDAAVVNPPRRGTSPGVRELLARLDLPCIAYVSCDPETLARDLDHFARLGYLATSLRPLDMIPLTDEVESVAILRKAPPSRPPVLFEDEDLIVAMKSPHEPTAPQGEYKSSLFARVRTIPGGERAVPIQRLDVGTSGVVVFARSPEIAARWTPAVEAAEARAIYVACVRGVTPAKGTITRDLREDGKVYPTRTRYRRLAVVSGHSVVRVIPEQTRTHQVRRHFSAIGHPVLGDDRYGHAPTNRFFEEKSGLDRTFLHCVRVELTNPSTGARLIVEAPLPGDLRMVLERVSGQSALKFLDQKQALGHAGVSSLPPPPDSSHSRGSVLDIDGRSSSLPSGSEADED